MVLLGGLGLKAVNLLWGSGKGALCPYGVESYGFYH